MALGEVVDKGLDVCRDGLVAPSAVTFLHPLLGIMPEWAMHLVAAIAFVTILAIVKDVRRNKHHRIAQHEAELASRHIPPQKLRRAPATV